MPNIKEALLLLIFLIVGDSLSMILGGVVWMLFGLTFAIPYVGRAVNLLSKRFFKLAVLVKLLAWCVGASGLVGAYLAFYGLYGPPDTVYEWWVVAGVAAYAVLRISHDIIMLEFYDVEASLRYFPKFSPKFLKERMPELDSDELSHLVRRNFADVNFSNLLQLLVSFGMLFFALSNLRLLPTSNDKVPTLTECLAVAFSLIGFVPSDVTFTGPVWLLIRLFAGIVLFVWVVVFVTLAINSLPSLQVAKAALGLPAEKPAPPWESTNARIVEEVLQALRLDGQAPVAGSESDKAQSEQGGTRREDRSKVERPAKRRSGRNRQGKHR